MKGQETVSAVFSDGILEESVDQSDLTSITFLLF